MKRDRAHLHVVKTTSALRRLERGELPEAAALLARTTWDDPLAVRAFAIADPQRRRDALRRFFIPVLCGIAVRGVVLGAYADETLAGICAFAPPGRCQPELFEKLRILRAIGLGGFLGRASRIAAWNSEWARRDLAEPHWHLGPVAVAPELQGKGIGTAMLANFCSSMEEYGATAYLETDNAQSVRFYARFDFEIVANAEILGVPNWFVVRRSR